MLRFCTYDVFTAQRYAGNPLAIVDGAESLSTAQMQTIAREFNLSETIFVMAPRDPTHDARVRIFFPTAEIPFAGHPTLGCAIWLARRRYGEGAFAGRIVLEEEAGIVPVDVTSDGVQVTGWFTAPILPHKAAGPVPLDVVAQATGLAPAQIGLGRQSPGHWQGGAELHLCSGDRSRGFGPSASDRAPLERLDRGPWDRGRLPLYHWARRHRLPSPYVGADGWDPRRSGDRLGDGDPCGPASGGGRLERGETTLTLTQGVEMGRPSQLGLKITVAKGALTSVRVGGTAGGHERGAVDPALNTQITGGW